MKYKIKKIKKTMFQFMKDCIVYSKKNKKIKNKMIRQNKNQLTSLTKV